MIGGVDWTFNAPYFGTNLSINWLAKPPTTGILPTKPYMPYLFLLNMFEKNPPTFYQNPGFFWFNDCPVGCLVPWLRDWSASLVRFILFSETAASPIILLLNPLSYSSFINLLDKPLRPSLPRSISRDLKSFIIFNWKKI